MHILVVDNEKIIADTLGLVLMGAGFDVTVAYSGKSALEMSRAVNPNVLLSDVIMGGMSGVELAISLKKEFSSCKVVLFSGSPATAKHLRSRKRLGSNLKCLQGLLTQG